MQDSLPDYSPPSSPTYPSNDSTVVSVSTTFGPTANLLLNPPDLIFLSSDAVFFYVHISQILSTTVNDFNSLLSDDYLTYLSTPTDAGTDPNGIPVVPIPESSYVLNIIFHSVYNLPCSHYNPSIDILLEAVDALPRYGLSPQKYVAPHTYLFGLLLARAPIRPIEVYALAGAHGLFELAMPVSSHLLSFPLHTLSDALMHRMGAPYLRRLFFLHFGRIQALKRLLLAPPYPHPPTDECDLTAQKKLRGAWSLAAAHLAWNATPGTYVRTLCALLCTSDGLDQICRCALSRVR